MLQTFTERSVIGGISEDDKLRAAGQVLYSENIDLTTNSDFYSVSQKPTISQATTDNISLIFEAGGEVFFCDKDSNLYREGVGTPVFTTEVFTAAWTNSTYLFLFTDDYDVWRIALSDLAQTSWISYLTEKDTSIPNPTTSSNPFVVGLEDNSYLAIGNNVYEITNSTGVVVAANTFTIDGEIVGLSLLEDSLEIFSIKGKYYLWDRIPGNEARVKSLGIPIGLVKNIGNRNYIISGGTFYTLNGYTLEQVFSDPYSDVLDSAKFNISAISPGLVTHSEGVFYIGVQGAAQSLVTPSNEFSFGDDAVLTVGVKKTGFPQARNLFLSRIDDLNIAEINYVYVKINPVNSFGKVLYIGYETISGVFGVATITIGDASGKYVGNNGILIYNTFDAGLKESQKSLITFRIRADLVSADNAIYLCLLNSLGEPEWFNGTQANSKIELSDLGDDGYYYFTPEGDYQFYNLTPALILENTSSTTLRREGVKVYSLSYRYDITRDR